VVVVVVVGEVPSRRRRMLIEVGVGVSYGWTPLWFTSILYFDSLFVSCRLFLDGLMQEGTLQAFLPVVSDLCTSLKPQAAAEATSQPIPVSWSVVVHGHRKSSLSHRFLCITYTTATLRSVSYTHIYAHSIQQLECCSHLCSAVVSGPLRVVPPVHKPCPSSLPFKHSNISKKNPAY